jgi:hypothetical protein
MANPVNRADGQTSLSKGEVGISLNMRGSCGEGAFGWGILDGLLNEPSIRIESMCFGASPLLPRRIAASGETYEHTNIF